MVKSKVVKIKCGVCGKTFKSKQGLGGHVATKHKGKAYPGSPLLSEGTRKKVAKVEVIAKMFDDYKPSPLYQLIGRLERLGQGAKVNEAFLADFSVLIREHASKQGISYENALAAVKLEKRLIDEIAKMF